MLLFAVSPDLRERFSAPIEELRILEEALDRGSEVYIDQLIKLADGLEPDEHTLERLLVQALADMELAAKAELEVTVSTQLDLPEPPDTSLELHEILDALEERTDIRLFTPDLEGASVVLHGALNGAGSSGKIDSFELQCSGVVKEAGELLTEEDFEPYPFSVRIHDPIGSVNFEHRYVNGQLGFTTETISGFRAWLQDHPTFTALFSKSGVDGEPLPALRTCWNLVREQSPLDALRDLETRRLATPRSVDLLGLKVPESLVQIAGPGLTLMVLWFLLAHVRHLRRHAASSLNEVRAFPWFPLFESRSGPALSLIVFVLLPSSSATLLLLRVSEASVSQAWYHPIPAITVGGLALAVAAQLMALRKEVHPQPSPLDSEPPAVDRSATVRTLASALDIEQQYAALLFAEGIDSADEARRLPRERLEGIKGIGPATVDRILDRHPATLDRSES